MQFLIGIVIVLSPSIVVLLGAYVLSVIRSRKRMEQRMSDFQRLQRMVS